MWTLERALPLIRDLAPLVRDLDYHLCLGGGVLNEEGERKDLDLWFIPLNGFESEPSRIYNLIRVVFQNVRAMRDSPDYQAGTPWHLKDAYIAEYEGNRVDLFVM